MEHDPGPGRDPGDVPGEGVATSGAPAGTPPSIYPHRRIFMLNRTLNTILSLSEVLFFNASNQLS